MRRPYFAPNLKAIRASLRGRRGRPKRHLPRTARNARCARRGGARCACPFDARAGFVDGMTRSLSWLVQRAGVVCGSFEEGATLLGEFTAATMSESTCRLEVLAAGRRAEADQRMKGRKLGLVPEYSSAQIASSVPCLPTLYCLMDGIGVPCVKKDLRKAKEGDGPAKTREIKVGGAKGCEIHVATADDAVEFGLMFRDVAIAAGYGRNNELRTLLGGDGASWIANVVDNGFHANVDGEHPDDDDFFMNDFFHAAEHLHVLVAELVRKPEDAAAQFERLKDLMWSKGAERACKDVVKTFGLPKKGTEARKQYDYLWERRRFMRYEEFRELQLFIGTGVMEAACRTDVARRCKQSGMHWRVFNASAMCALVARIRTQRKAA